MESLSRQREPKGPACPGPGPRRQLCPSVSLVQAESITFTVVQPPRHGRIERTSNGQRYHPATTFTMDDVYQNRVSYAHDGSSSLKDRFAFTVSDGTNPFFIMQDGGKQVGGGGRRGRRPPVAHGKLVIRGMRLCLPK